MKLRHLMLGSDADAMRVYCIERLGVDPWQFGCKFVGMKQGKCFPYDGDEGNLAAIKSELHMRGAFPCCGIMPTSGETSRLHVFFLTLEETQEMLARLPRGEEVTESRVARSKIGNTMQNIFAVNETSKRVTKVSKRD